MGTAQYFEIPTLLQIKQKIQKKHFIAVSFNLIFNLDTGSLLHFLMDQSQIIVSPCHSVGHSVLLLF